MTDEEQKALEELRSQIDKAGFATKPFAKKVNKPWGWEIHFVEEGMPYMGKLIHIEPGRQLSLQVHDKKTESYTALSGDAILIIENPNGELDQIIMEEGKGYTTKLGQKHRLKAGDSACDIIEFSTPEIGNTYRLEDDYSRPTETEELRQNPNRGWE